jgi:hypothetical protein
VNQPPSPHSTHPAPSRRAAAAEDVIDPAPPICDPHHHLSHRAGQRYLLDELLADTGATDAHGRRHNLRSTVTPAVPTRCSSIGGATSMSWPAART